MLWIVQDEKNQRSQAKYEQFNLDIKETGRKYTKIVFSG